MSQYRDKYDDPDAFYTKSGDDDLNRDEAIKLTSYMRSINRALNKGINNVKNTFKHYIETDPETFKTLLPYINDRLSDRDDYDDISSDLTKMLRDAWNEVKMNKNFSRIDKVLNKYNKNFSTKDTKGNGIKYIDRVKKLMGIYYEWDKNKNYCSIKLPTDQISGFTNLKN